MKLYIRKNHPINKIDGRPIKKAIMFWLKKWGIVACDYVCIAIDNGKVVAFMRFDKYNSKIEAVGTWVDATYRGQGIAKKMWERVLSFSKPSYVEVIVTTRAGNNLIKSLVAKYSNDIVFNISYRLNLYNQTLLRP